MNNKQLAFPLLTLMLAMLVAVAPMAIDMYLPAIQIMAQDLQTPIHEVELSISTFLFGFAIGQLFGGPLSDKFGRKPVIGLGLSIFILTSLALTAVETLDNLLILRAIQAFGGGIAIVNSSAMVRDLFSGSDVARVLSTISLVMMLAPLLAPMLGALTVEMFGWRTIFFILAGYALFVLVIFLVKVPESRKKSESTSNESALKIYKRVISHRHAMGYVMAISFTFGGLFTFITSAPFIFMEHFGVDNSTFPFLFGANVLLLMVVNRINIRLLDRFDSKTLLKTGQMIQLVFGIAMIVAAWFDAGMFMVLACSMGFIASLGLIGANSVSCCLNYFPDVSGSANAVLGVTEFTLGAVAGVVWALIHENFFPDLRLMPMAVTMLGCAIAGIIALRVLTRGSDAGYGAELVSDEEPLRKAS
ncbi:Bcr/CflA family multidrug efflux MFS transporter [Parendozoicomonas haliclonae]|uniref:Bcr/CflA family efflux transporter n=1 Tax=Parendozoicomonas haliclonae TaxID=1960125 RepID=A0A1X7AQ49_9GAMM|nr:Bcr/CflA family multidrug efflux MFS transporter [Parendozoicomonas haliclonae]SMA50230.1 Bicyclomycin resistance protein [Parendozoicomonas haliclonae]